MSRMMRCGSSYCYYVLQCLLLPLLLLSCHARVNACEFKCDDGTCINNLDVCNGQKDCPDGSDETHQVCSSRPCRNALGLEDLIADHNFGLGEEGIRFTSSFRCDYGACITTNFKCNGINNCFDGSDETSEACKDTTCSASSFRCAYGACISRNLVCDGENNCHDGSDEKKQNCVFKTVPRRVVCPKRSKNYCDDRRGCYDRFQECDGKYDCADRSDEKEELCQKLPTTPSAITSTTTTATTAIQPIEIDSSGAGDNCSVDNVRGVSVDVLQCGNKPHTSCVRNREVPPLTTVLDDCWGVSSTLMRCHNDGYWRTFGAQVSEHDRSVSFDDLMEKQPMKNLCQPYYMNSEVCGRRPRYKSTGTGLNLGHFHSRKENRWPMVMGLKKRERYECSATLITPLFLLTAAHCVVVSQESRNETMHPNDLRVQLSNKREEDQRVQAIILHPDYEQRRNPLNDLALIKLERPLIFNAKLYPACVDLDGEGFITEYRAMTFSRANGENGHKYTEIRQQIDPNCYNPIDRCRGQQQIEDTQFCGVDLDTKRYLEGGSSGGPFMQNLGTEAFEEWAISGVVSFNIETQSCGLPHTVFTAIHAFKLWITNIVHDESYVDHSS